MNMTLKAARYFIKAGREMRKKGHRSLEETALLEAKKIYDDIIKNNPSTLTKSDYGNMGYIDGFLPPKPGEIICCYPPPVAIWKEWGAPSKNWSARK
jgi:hypothetical protein